MLNCTFDALLAFSHCAVWKADHEKVDAAVHADLYSDGDGINTLKGSGVKSDEQKRDQPLGAVCLDAIDEGMDALNVHLLNSICISRPPHPDLHIAKWS